MKHSSIVESGDSVKIKAPIRSHAFKRSSVQKLSEHISPHVFCERVGFMMRNVHTIFEYIFNTEKQDKVSGKTVQNWLARHNGEVLGEMPPTIDAITVASEKYLYLLNHCFGSELFPC